MFFYDKIYYAFGHFPVASQFAPGNGNQPCWRLEYFVLAAKVLRLTLPSS